MKKIILIIVLIVILGGMALILSTGLIKIPVLSDILYGKKADLGIEISREAAEIFNKKLGMGVPGALRASIRVPPKEVEIEVTEVEFTSWINEIVCKGLRPLGPEPSGPEIIPMQSSNPRYCPFDKFQAKFEPEKFTVSYINFSLPKEFPIKGLENLKGDITLVGSVSKRDQKSIELDLYKMWIGKVSVPFPIRRKVEKAIEDEVNRILKEEGVLLMGIRIHRIDEIQILDGAARFKGIWSTNWRKECEKDEDCGKNFCKMQREKCIEIISKCENGQCITKTKEFLNRICDYEKAKCTHLPYTFDEYLFFNPNKNSGWIYIARTVPKDGVTFWVAMIRSLSTRSTDDSAQLLYGITDIYKDQEEYWQPYYSGFIEGGLFHESSDTINAFYEKDGKKLVELITRRLKEPAWSSIELRVNLPWGKRGYYQTEEKLGFYSHQPVIYESGYGVIPMGKNIDSLYVSLPVEIFGDFFVTGSLWIDFQKFNLEISPLKSPFGRFGKANHKWSCFVLDKSVGNLPKGTVGVYWEILDENNQRQPGGYTNFDLFLPGKFIQKTEDDWDIQELEYWSSENKTYLKKWKIIQRNLGIDLIFETLISNQENCIFDQCFYEGAVRIFDPITGRFVGTGMLEQTHDEASD